MPKGGTHDWTIDESGDQVCSNCLEPEPKKTTKANPERTAKADGKLSAIDAAAKVLGETGEHTNTKQTVEAMAEKGYW